MRSAPAGTGIIAGGPINQFEVVGIQDVVAKSLARQILTMYLACIKGLRSQISQKFCQILEEKISEIISKEINNEIK